MATHDRKLSKYAAAFHARRARPQVAPATRASATPTAAPPVATAKPSVKTELSDAELERLTAPQAKPPAPKK